MSEKLKTCPFCGSSDLQSFDFMEHEFDGRNGIQCMNCGVSCTGWDAGVDRGWNTRADLWSQIPKCNVGDDDE